MLSVVLPLHDVVEFAEVAWVLLLDVHNLEGCLVLVHRLILPHAPHHQHCVFLTPIHPSEPSRHFRVWKPLKPSI